MALEHNGSGRRKKNERPGLSQYRVIVESVAGGRIETQFFSVDQTLGEMDIRVREFINMLANHCYQLTIDDQFVGNFRERSHAHAYAESRPGSRPVLIEVFPTSPQKCLDD